MHNKNLGLCRTKKFSIKCQKLSMVLRKKNKNALKNEVNK